MKLRRRLTILWNFKHIFDWFPLDTINMSWNYDLFMVEEPSEWRLPSDGPPLTTLRGCSMNLLTFASILSWVGLLLAGAGCCMGLVLCRGTSSGAGAATVIVILSLGWTVIIIYILHCPI